MTPVDSEPSEGLARKSPRAAMLLLISGSSDFREDQGIEEADSSARESRSQNLRNGTPPPALILTDETLLARRKLETL